MKLDEDKKHERVQWTEWKEEKEDRKKIMNVDQERAKKAKNDRE